MLSGPAEAAPQTASGNASNSSPSFPRTCGYLTLETNFSAFLVKGLDQLLVRFERAERPIGREIRHALGDTTVHNRLRRERDFALSDPAECHSPSTVAVKDGSASSILNSEFFS
jgi:hypothetical protein